MGKTLGRYLLREVVSLLLLGLVLTTFVLASVQMVDLVDLALAKGVALWRVATVFGYMVPSYLELTLPMAFLLSIVATFTRLARGGEVLAMRAAGVSFLQLTLPLAGLALAVSALELRRRRMGEPVGESRAGAGDHRHGADPHQRGADRRSLQPLGRRSRRLRRRHQSQDRRRDGSDGGRRA